MTNKRQPDAILAADIHIRHDTPMARTDNFFQAMENKINFILNLHIKYRCPVLVAGDLGHKPQWKNWLLEWTINKFKNHDIISICGQHDLPNHRIDQFDKSGCGVLHAAGAVNFIWEPIICNKNIGIDIYPFSWNEEITPAKYTSHPNIAIIHKMIVQKKDLFPDQNAIKGHEILEQNPSYNLILSGDNHQPFVSEYEGRILCNPGSMMRTTTKQENHKPRVYLYYAKENRVEPVYLPIEKNVIDKTHIEIAEDKKNRNEHFIKRVNDMTEIELSYENNLESYFNKFRTEKKIKEKTWEHVK